MQDPTAFQPLKSHGFPEQEQLKCPRCDSTNTKFCYYNNYNLSQPRHFCKNCRRYWTKGGTLRNIPVGGGSRKNTKRSTTTTKRSSASPSPSPSSSSPSVPSSIADTDPTRVYATPSSGSFSSLLASSGHMGSLFGGLNSNGSALKMADLGQSAEDFASSVQRVANSGSEMQSNNGDSERYLGLQNGGNGWSNLAMYTPGSSFH